jgi:pimeloyl-ACP methyl ester carboxylesterase
MPFVYAPHHREIEKLPADPNSYVILTRNEAKAAVVFVHGFTGKARETWQGFEEGATQSEAFRNVDLYFFGYDGFLSNTLAATSFLYSLLQGLGTDPAPLLGTLADQADRDNRAKGYERIVVVAHSLGAVVSRWALVRAAEEKAPWATKIRYLLFAPAHRGSDLARLAAEGLGGLSWLKPLLEGLKAGSPLIRELDRESPVLQELEERTRELLPENPFLKATRVVIAEREVVVNNWIFAGDPFPQALRGTTHESVCKPSAVQPEPLRILTELL